MNIVNGIFLVSIPISPAFFSTLFDIIIILNISAYAYSRKQQHEMCYTLRRGEVSFDRLGQESVICRQVGHLFPGLAVGPNSTHLFLNVSVRYRGNLDDINSEEEPQHLLQPQPRRPRSRRPWAGFKKPFHLLIVSTTVIQLHFLLQIH